MDPVDVVVPEDEPEQLVAKEMYDAEYEHIDAVKGPAHSMKFVVIKAQSREPDYEAVMKVKYSAEQQRDMLSKGQAFKGPDGEPSYPIGDVADLGKAIHAVGRGGADHDAIRAYIIRRAKALGHSDDIPENWAADGSLKEDSVKKAAKQQQSSEPAAEKVKKADGDLNAGEILAEPVGGADGSATAPSSAAWEAVDAATSQKWTGILARAKVALSVLADRENQEAALGSDGDMEDAWNLEDAMCAIDYAISILATHAVGEQAESDIAQDVLDGVAKTMTAFKTDGLETIESLMTVKKAGRVLSASNEQAIRDAVSSLQKVLSSLPEAPADVAKSQERAVDTQPKPEEAPQPKPEEPAAAPVEKAKGDPMVPVYDANGKLCGMVDAEDVVPIADAPGAEKTPAPAPTEAGQDGKEVAGAEQAAPAAVAPPSGAANAAPAEAAPDQQAVAKALISPQELEEIVRAEVAKALAARSEEDRAIVVKSLEESLKTYVNNLPRPHGPKLSAAALGDLVQTDGGQIALRGQSDPVEDPEIQRVTKALAEATDPVEIAQLNQELSTRKLTLRLGGK